MGMDIYDLSSQKITDMKFGTTNSRYNQKKAERQRDFSSGPADTKNLFSESIQNTVQAVERGQSFRYPSVTKHYSVKLPLSSVKREQPLFLKENLSDATVLPPGYSKSELSFYKMSSPVAAPLQESSTINLPRQAIHKADPTGRWKAVSHGFAQDKYIEFNFHDGRMVEDIAVNRSNSHINKENKCFLEITKLQNQDTEVYAAKGHACLNFQHFEPINTVDHVKAATQTEFPIGLSEQQIDASGLVRRDFQSLEHGAKDPDYISRLANLQAHESSSDCCELPSPSVCQCSLAYEIDAKSFPYPGCLKPSPHMFADHIFNARSHYELDAGSIEQLKKQWSALKEDPIIKSNSSASPYEAIHYPNTLSYHDSSEHSIGKDDFSSEIFTFGCNSVCSSLSVKAIAAKDAQRNASSNIKKQTGGGSDGLSSLRVFKSPRFTNKSFSVNDNDNKSCRSLAWSWKSPLKSTRDFVWQSGSSLSASKSPMSSPSTSNIYSFPSNLPTTSSHNRDQLKSPLSASTPDRCSRSYVNTECDPSAMKSGSRCLLAPRFTQLGPGKSLSICAEDPCSTLVSGHIHCFVRNGMPSFTFFIDGSNEALVARSWRTESTKHDFMYAFYSWKQRRQGKGKYWKSWRKKDRSGGSNFLGKMTVTSKVIHESQRKYLTFEHVLFKEIINDQETDLYSVCDTRASASSWDTLSCQSPQLSTNCHPSPSLLNLFSPPPGVIASPSPRFTASPALEVIPQNLLPLPVNAQNIENFQHLNHSSPFRTDQGEDYLGQYKCVYKNPLGKANVGDFCLDTHLEHAGVVIKIPLEIQTSTSLAHALILGRDWGWGWNSLHNQSLLKDNFLTESKLLSNYGQQNRASALENIKLNGKVTSCSSKDLRSAVPAKSKHKGKENKGQNGFASGMAMRKDQVNVTIILPSGDHGRPLYGLSGPQPLIERWEHGGRCDCGSWDLGCGLSILHAQLPGTNLKSAKRFQPAVKSLSGTNETDDNVLKVFLQDSKEKQAVMSLKRLCDGLFSLTFQAPLSPFQAFASAVAILYSMEPITQH